MTETSPPPTHRMETRTPKSPSLLHTYVPHRNPCSATPNEPPLRHSLPYATTSTVVYRDACTPVTQTYDHDRLFDHDTCQVHGHKRDLHSFSPRIFSFLPQ